MFGCYPAAVCCYMLSVDGDGDVDAAM